MFGRFLERWSLQRQLVIALSGTVLVVGLTAGELVRRMETSYLEETFQQQSHRTFSLLSATSLDAIVSEDRPLLETIVSQTVSYEPDIFSLAVENEAGEVLARWKTREPSPAARLVQFSDEVVFEGESFGRINIEWDIQSLIAEIERHARRIRIFSMACIAFFGLLIVLGANRLVVTPIRKIHTRLGELERNETGAPLQLSAATEFMRLGESVNALGEVLALKQKREAELEEASQAKSNFLANMSHELRTPLNGVLGMLSLFKDTKLTGKQHEWVRTAISSGKTLLALINDILDFSKIEAGRLELERIDFDLREVIEESVELLARQAHSKGLELTAVIAADVPAFVRGDPTRTRQVLTNLLANAVKFTERGEVVLEVESVSSDSGESMLRFSVRDTGLGISEDALSRVFESFTQADGSTTRHFGGSGLGLAICQQLAEHMGGEIDVESKLGEGSTFWFTIRTELSEKIRAPFAPAAGLRGLRVLVAAQNPTMRRALEQQFAEWGMPCEVAEDGRECLDMAISRKAAGAPFDLAIFDAPMPGENSHSLREDIEREPDLDGLKLVLLTPFSSVWEDTVDSGRDNSVTTLSKPMRQRRLHDCIARLVGLAESPSREPDVCVDPVADAHRDIRRQKRILIVEDNEVNQQVVLSMLSKLEYQSVIAGDGMQALSLVKLENFDCILMDCQMPVVDGYEATKSIRRFEGNGKRLPIVALTANAMSGDAEKCFAAGMDDYLSKPFDIDTLASKLAKWLLTEASPDGHSTLASVVPVTGTPRTEDSDGCKSSADDRPARKTGTDGTPA